MNEFKKNKVRKSLNQFTEYLNQKFALYNYLSYHFHSQNLQFSQIQHSFMSGKQLSSRSYYLAHKNILIITIFYNIMFIKYSQEQGTRVRAGDKT